MEWKRNISKRFLIVDNKLNAELKEVIAISEDGDYDNAKGFLTHEDKIFFFKE